MTTIPSSTVQADSPAPAPTVVEKDNRDEAEIAARAAIEEFMKLPLKERQAKIASTLDRGIINDRLAVELPPDLYGEWVRNDPLETERMISLGFWDDNVYSARRAIHSDGTSASKIGDVHFMVCMRETKNMIDKIMQEKSDNNVKSKKQQQEEKAFMADTERDTQGVIPTFSESTSKGISMDNVRAAMEAANKQTVVKR